MSTPDPAHIDAVALAIVDPYAGAAEVVLAGEDAVRLLTSTDPAVHAAMLEALTRGGVLAQEERTYAGHGDVWTEARLVTGWREITVEEVAQP